MIKFFFVLLMIFSSKGLRLTEITADIRLNRLKGDLALGSVADLNSDRYSDLLLINRSDNNKDQLLVVLWNAKKSRFEHKFTYQTNASLVSSSTADFNGDGRVDILLVTDSEGKGLSYSVLVVWSEIDGPMFSSSTMIEHSVQMLPLILDFNGDHLPDILTVAEDQLTVWISEHQNCTFSKTLFPDYDKIALPQRRLTAAYTDINSDCLADLIITSYPDEGVVPLIYVWLRDAKTMNFTWSQTVSLPLQQPDAAGPDALFGPPSYIDFNADGVLDMVMVSCDGPSSCHIHLLMQKSLSGVLDCKSRDASKWNITWGGVTSVDISYSMNIHHVAKYRPVLGGVYNFDIGSSTHVLIVIEFSPISDSDIDLDGYPDLMLTVSSNGSNSSSAILMMNTKCGGCRAVKNTRMRSLKLAKNKLLNSVQNVVSAIFIDLSEDGIFDVLLTSTSDRSSQFTALQQTLNKDHLFVKALVLSGSCYEDCASGSKPYGSSLPGAVVLYQTQDRNGRTVIGMGVSTLGSSVLNNPTLPYTILGLGETPNYIEKLTFGVPHGHHGKKWHRKWELLVPNSQVILVPKPPQKPDKWTLLLYLTPSDLVYSVAGVLAGVCAGLLIIVIVFHAREKFLDRKERKKARQKFHFNVM